MKVNLENHLLETVNSLHGLTDGHIAFTNIMQNYIIRKIVNKRRGSRGRLKWDYTDNEFISFLFKT